MPQLCLMLSLSAMACQPPDEKIDLGEANSGGATTVFDRTKHAFGQPARNIESLDRQRFLAGHDLFEKQWRPDEGLGPLFHASACESCHQRDGRALPIDEDGPTPALLIRTSLAQSMPQQPHPQTGWQLAINGHEVSPEGIAQVTFEPYKPQQPKHITNTLPSLIKPNWSIRLNQPPQAPLDLSARAAPPLIGLGLLEAIPVATLKDLADPDDENQDGISGRIHWVQQDGKRQAGRFGWKAGQPTLRAQNAAALRFDMGLTTTLFPKEDCGSQQTECLSNQSATAELTDDQLDTLTFYVALLAVPGRRDLQDPQVQRGKALFSTLKCSGCHIPTLKTGASAHAIGLEEQVIHPYTDLLLHDMGDGLADQRAEGDANGREWRTPPLWGIGLTKTVNGHTRFLHDGRARSLEEAILWHGGEAQPSQEHYLQLSSEARAALLAFLNSL